MDCRTCFLVDDKGRVLFARGAGRPYPNASTTKMVTALVVAERTQGDEKVVVSATAEEVPGGKLSLYAGEEWSVDELLKALLMSSSNDAAVALAEHVAGTERAFVELMNEKAASLGALQSSFVTSHGLDQPGHHASARDLALFADELLAQERLAPIVGSRTAVIASPPRRERLENTNLLLEGYRGATGVKTGFTALAGNVLVASAERQGRRLIAVAMGSPDPLADSRELLDAGFASLRRTVLLGADEILGALVSGTGASVTVAAALDVRGMTDPDRIVTRFEPGDVTLPVRTGDSVGHVEVLADGTLIASVPAVARSNAAASAAPGWIAEMLATVLRSAADLIPGEDGPQ
ncbi:MAG: D-alanyl-D-alanine carboxypeptidase family protein [Actinomycetota bacterium]